MKAITAEQVAAYQATYKYTPGVSAWRPILTIKVRRALRRSK